MLGNGTGNARTNLLWIILCMVDVDMWRSPLGASSCRERTKEQSSQRAKDDNAGVFQAAKTQFWALTACFQIAVIERRHPNRFPLSW